MLRTPFLSVLSLSLVQELHLPVLFITLTPTTVTTDVHHVTNSCSIATSSIITVIFSTTTIIITILSLKSSSPPRPLSPWSSPLNCGHHHHHFLYCHFTMFSVTIIPMTMTRLWPSLS